MCVWIVMQKHTNTYRNIQEAYRNIQRHTRNIQAIQTYTRNIHDRVCFVCIFMQSGIVQAAGYRLQAAGYRLQAAGCRLQAAGYRLQATGYKLQATGSKLQATGYRLQATGYRLQATGCRLQAAGYRLHAAGYKLQAAGYRLLAGLVGWPTRCLLAWLGNRITIGLHSDRFTKGILFSIIFYYFLLCFIIFYYFLLCFNIFYCFLADPLANELVYQLAEVSLMFFNLGFDKFVFPIVIFLQVYPLPRHRRTICNLL